MFGKHRIRERINSLLRMSLLGAVLLAAENSGSEEARRECGAALNQGRSNTQQIFGSSNLVVKS